MKLTLGTTVIVFLAVIFFGALTLRWTNYKLSPSISEEEVHFKIDRDIVKNPEKNKEYYGTVIVTTKKQAGKWPFVEIVIERDTLTQEEGGFFGRTE